MRQEIDDLIDARNRVGDESTVQDDGEEQR